MQRQNPFVYVLLLCSLAPAQQVAAYVDPLFGDGFETFACSDTDQPQPNAGIGAEAGSGGCTAGMVKGSAAAVTRRLRRC